MSDTATIEAQDLCPICTVRLKVIWREGELVANNCPQCGFTFSGVSSVRVQFEERYFQYQLKMAGKRIRHFRQLISALPVQLEAPILDVGAGLGHFLRALPPNLANAATLVEPSDFARQYLNRSTAAGAFSSLAEIPSHRLPFATITFWDVLAHVENPVDTLLKSRGLMRSGGLLVIKTPYHPIRLFKAARLLSPIHKGRSLLHIPSMRTHFAPSSLQALLSVTGFRAISWQWVSEPPLVGRQWLLSKSLLLRLAKHLVLGHISFVMIARAQ